MKIEPFFALHCMTLLFCPNCSIITLSQRRKQEKTQRIRSCSKIEELDILDLDICNIMPFTTSYSNGPLAASSRSPTDSDSDTQRASLYLRREAVRLKAQKILAQRRRTEANEQWADANAPKEFTFEDQRHRLRLLLIEAIRHHSERQNKTLLLKVFKAIERKNPSEGLSKLGVTPAEVDAFLFASTTSTSKSAPTLVASSAASPTTTANCDTSEAQPQPPHPHSATSTFQWNHLEKAILRNMFQDIDFIMETHENGDRLAARALEQFRLWEQ